MGLVDKPAFSAGEIDPALWERTNLDKFRNGLATGRNWIISKTGSVLTRPGRQYFAACKLQNSSVRLYSPPGSGVLMEFGNLYIRFYSLSTWLQLAELDTFPFTEADLTNLHFDTSGSYVYVFCSGKYPVKINYVTMTLQTYSNGVFTGDAMFTPPSSPGGFGSPAVGPGTITAVGTPTGYPVQYLITYVYKGEESLPAGPFGGSSPNTFDLPVANGQSISITGYLVEAAASPAWFNPYITEMRVYRRPYDTTAGEPSGAWGYIGSSTNFFEKTVSGTNCIAASFTDFGQAADYTHQPPQALTAPLGMSAVGPADPGTVLLPNTGIAYQQRLLMTDSQTDLEAIYASQPGFQDNFYENFPLDNSSALKFKCGTSGYARVLRMLDSDGLVAFTAAGIFLNQGALTPDNIAMTKKGKWIINPVVPALPVPGGVMFLDSMTNSVRNLMWSFYFNGFDAPEVSIYSNHLFRSRAVVTWNFMQGTFPLLWVVFSDGTAASFTYDYNQQMQAWMRHDSAIEIESCCGSTNGDQNFFVVKKTDAQGNVNRYIEVTLPRYTLAADIASDPDYDKNASCAYMDGIVTGKTVLNDSLKGTDQFMFEPTQFLDAQHQQPDWTGVLNLTCGTSGIWLLYTQIPPSTPPIFRFFDNDGSKIDLKYIGVIDANTIQVQVGNIKAFPSQYAGPQATAIKLYQTINQITGLTMLEGEYPAVIVDGAVICSPNNDQENYAQLQVVNGTLTLPAGVRAAIMHVGRPIVGDLETLEIDTVDQQPTLIESQTVNKVYLKVKDARGLYVGPRFPNGGNGESLNGITDMTPVDSLQIDYSKLNPIIGNRAQPSYTKRYEVIPMGDWSQQGKVCIRQVDPLHAEILSIIPDVEVQYRERT